MILLFKQHKYAILTILFFAVVYALISIVNHLNLQTFALDLGLYNNTIYSYAHFKLNQSSLILPYVSARNQLSDHFDLMLMLISPLYFIFGSYTLLIIQIAAILFGGLGVYKYVKHLSSSICYANLALIHFLVLWGIYAALSFDYHSNVVAAMFIPWLFYAVKIKHRLLALCVTVAAIICKENIALYWFFLLAGLLVANYKYKTLRYLLAGLAILCLVYFYAVMFIFIPNLLPKGVTYIHFEYSCLGENFYEAIRTVITKPLYTLKLMFNDWKNRPDTAGIKPELHLYVLLCGGFTMFTRPQFILPAAIIYAQKLFHNDYTKWGILGQYSIEFVPLICLSLFIFLHQFKNKNGLAVIFIVISSALTIKSFYGTYSKWHHQRRVNIFSSSHYQSAIEVKKVIKVIKNIPQHLKVSCSTQLAPHIANRDTLYQFPFIGNADLIILLKNPDTFYPLNEERFGQALVQLNNNTYYTNCYTNNNLIVYKQKDLDYCIKE